MVLLKRKSLQFGVLNAQEPWFKMAIVLNICLELYRFSMINIGFLGIFVAFNEHMLPSITDIVTSLIALGQDSCHYVVHMPGFLALYRRRHRFLALGRLALNRRGTCRLLSHTEFWSGSNGVNWRPTRPALKAKPSWQSELVQGTEDGESLKSGTDPAGADWQGITHSRESSMSTLNVG